MKKTIAVLVLSFAVLFGLAHGATLTVTKTADTADGVCNADCSLREAIAAAASGDTIEFASPLFDSGQIITLALGELYNNKNLTINGRSAALTVIYGNDQTRVFDNGGNLTLNQITITGSKDRTGSGIYNDVGSTMILNDSVVTGNRLEGSLTGGFVYQGAGIYNAPNTTLTITNCTISNNTGNPIRENVGIGIVNYGAMTITDSTISGNVIIAAINQNRGGGIYNQGTATIINTTISGNNIFASNFISAAESIMFKER